MSVAEARYRIQTLKRRYLLLRALEIILYASAGFLLVFALTGLFTSSLIWKLSLSSFAVLIIVTQQVLHYKIFSLSHIVFIQYLNRHYPQLEESADLFMQAETAMNPLQQLQLEKTLNNFNSLYPKIKLPNSLAKSLVVLVVGVLFYFGLTAFLPKPILTTEVAGSSPLEQINGRKKPKAVTIKKLSIEVSPPAYTAIKNSTAESPHLLIPEGSVVNWTANFSDEIIQAKILFSGKDSIVMKKMDANSYSTTRVTNESGFYQIQWQYDNDTITSDYYKIELIKDQVPKVTIDNLNQFTRFSFSDNLTVLVKSTLRDDYGLADASIIATVSKGSGESVKFREERLRFERPKKISGKNVAAEITLNLNKLGMEPGDELYFYVEAMDNKKPTPNYNRTETFFIALQDTAKVDYVEDEGLGVDLMPEYFRSQRQIIFDSEKLLRERKRMTKQQFNSTSNELGYDQKVLRLRYGQFLGEEFEGQIGKAEVDDHEDESTEEIIEKFSHTHDKENEHNLVAEKKPSVIEHAHNDPNAKEDPLAAFAHNHDDGEVATFFVQSVRAKLKAALTVMWDAELHLRLFDPEKSLPYQYTALKLLKEISNDSRIYVHRTGFDPPPLKEEKRLTGDLSEVQTSTGKRMVEENDSYQNIRKALTLTEQMVGANRIETSATEQQIFYKAGQELAQIVLEQPNYLEGLTSLKSLVDGEGEAKEQRAILLKVRSVLWRVLPQQPSSPTKKQLTTHSLDQQFLQSLETLRNE